VLASRRIRVPRGPIALALVSSRDWTALSGDAVSSAYSDHHHLRGWARLIHP
jgi:hypothetical protein